VKLFDPIKIGSRVIKNRIVMAPMTTHFADRGYVTERLIDYYGARAKGGVGLLTVEDGIIDYPTGNNTDNPLSIDDDKYMPMLNKLSTVIKEHGAVSMLQISHAGRRAGRLSPRTGCLEMTQGHLPVAPSPLAHPVPGFVVPKPLSIEDIEKINEKFVQAAKRAVDAGFEMIGLHCAHMYLCGQFLSPWSNKRSDVYGREMMGRMKFVLDIIRKIKETVGEDIPIVCRMNGQEPEGGNSLTELQEIARQFEKAGVHAIHVSVGFGFVLWETNFLPAEAPMGMPEGCIVHLAENIKKAVSIPVIAVNKIRHVDFAERILKENKADMIALGRPLLADPEWPNKALNDKKDEIKPCVSCCQGCVKGIEKGQPITCLINPLVGREKEIRIDIVPEAVVKKVLIIGGGPAGLMTAINAAKRGHKITLWEKENRLGGEMHLAMKPPRKLELQEVLDYLKRRIQQMAIKVILNKKVDAEGIKAFSPDVVILATGSKFTMPKIEGMNNPQVITAINALKNDEDVGKKIAIIGGGLVGLETAEYFAEKGKKITLIEMQEDVGLNMPFLTKVPLLLNLQEHGVTILTNALVRKIMQKHIEIEQEGIKKRLGYDTIILSMGGQPDDQFEKELINSDFSVYSVGNCHQQGDLLTAIHDGFMLGLRC